MIRMESEQGKLVCHFEGRLDTAKCQEFEAQVQAGVQATQAPVVFDLKGVDYIASAFLRLCLAAYKQVGPERFSIVNVHPFVKKVLMISNLSDLMKAG
ncbi:MAG: STAS domain-containing protein [Terriglobia bacterium]|jgi:anti-anti-sigma factor